MAASSFLQLLVEGRGDAAEVFAAYDEGKRRERDERRARFVPLGAPADCLAPAAQVFHEHSKISPGFWPLMTAEEAERFTLDLDYRRYPEAKRAALPRSSSELSGLESAILQRRSVRKFAETPLALAELAKILELGCGVTQNTDGVPRRAYPSGGALYPVEVYPVALRVDGVASGVYHYATLDHELEQLRGLAGIEDVRRAFPELVPQANPALILMLTVSFPRAFGKYAERGYRFALIEAGHIAQNVLLIAGALGLESVCMGGFFDDDANTLLGVDPTREAAVYGVLLGRAR